MFKSFTIKNFRCFDYLTLEPLAQFNLIGGVNNTGKTSVLEALFIYLRPNNPSLPISINSFRGIQQYKFTDNSSLTDSPWGWLFLGNQIDRTIELSSVNEQSLKQSLQIQLDYPMVSPSIAPRNSDSTPLKFPSSTRAFNRHVLVLKYQSPEQEAAISRIFVMPNGGIQWESAELPPLPMAVFSHARGFPAKEDAERFSSLERANRQKEILSALQPLEPRLKRLALLVQGDVPIIAGDIGIGELVPISLMGAGVGRLLSLVLAIADAPNGTVLIDEVENGLHYSILIKVWEVIKHAAQQHNTQIFATTHSLECIRAAHQAFNTGDVYNFCYHRLERVRNEIKTITYDRETITTSIDMNFEMR